MIKFCNIFNIIYIDIWTNWLVNIYIKVVLLLNIKKKILNYKNYKLRKLKLFY